MQEQAKINYAIQLAKDQDAKQAAARRTAGAALLKEITAENTIQIQRKKAEKALEVEEDMRRLAYAKAQDAKARVRQSNHRKGKLQHIPSFSASPFPVGAIEDGTSHSHMVI